MAELPARLERAFVTDAPGVPDASGESAGTRQLTPTPLDLAELPVVRSVQRLEKTGPDGRLPREAYHKVHEVLDLAGTRYRVEISGSPEHGLPLGNDADVLIALFHLADERGYHDGVFRDPSFQAIARALGGEASQGRTVWRIQDALRRLSQVSILSRATQDHEQLALGIQEGEEGAHPLAPTTKVPRTTYEQARWLIEYDVRLEEHRRKEGAQERWIEHLAISPFWMYQAIGGWAAWIDLELFSRLSGPVAKRLYCLTAARAARGSPPPWHFPLAELVSACALGPNRPARHRAMISQAADTLVQHGVLSNPHYSGSRGSYTFLFEPGKVLEEASLLRGVGLMDLHRLRVQVALLQWFGVSGPQARSMVLEDAGGVREVLSRALYLRECESERVKNFPGWIRRAFQERWSFEGDEAYDRWRGRRALEVQGEGVRRKSAIPEQLPVQPSGTGDGGPEEGAKDDRPDVDPRDERARELWDQVIGTFLGERGAPSITSGILALLAPLEIQGSVLVCVSRRPFPRDWLLKQGTLEELGGIAEGLSEGEVTEIQVVLEETLETDAGD